MNPHQNKPIIQIIKQNGRYQQQPIIQKDQIVQQNKNFNGSLEEAAHYYYNQANKLFYSNIILNNQLKSVIEEKNSLALRLSQLQKQLTENSQIDKSKRHRRTANAIERSFKCPIQSCQKSYGSQGSLSQHIKLKHLEFYNSNISMNMQLDIKVVKKITDKHDTQENQKKQET